MELKVMFLLPSYFSTYVLSVLLKDDGFIAVSQRDLSQLNRRRKTTA